MAEVKKLELKSDVTSFKLRSLLRTPLNAAIIIAIIVSLPSFGQTGQVYGTFRNTSMDLSNYPGWMDLISNDSGATLGIGRKEALGGIVKIDQYYSVITTGAGIFAGSDVHKWPSAQVFFVMPDGDIFKDLGISGLCTNVYYEGIVINQKISIKKSDNTTTTYYAAKPILGKFDNFTSNTEPTKLLSESEKDFSDGYLDTKEYGRIKVLIVSSLQDVALIFVVEKQSSSYNKNGNPKKEPPNVIKSPIGVIAISAFVIFLLVGVVILFIRKRQTKNK